jgi:NAD(P)-dependent dehydrogenase (short-subunit alcohol dehydrogenase family)
VTGAANPLDLRGRRFLVTGAASGIGLTTALLLSRLGGQLVVIDSNSEGLARALSMFEGNGHVSHCWDLRKLDEIPSFLLEISASGGPLFGLVHAAGLSCIQHKKVADPAGGSIVFLASVMALVGSPGAVAYGMTKGAIIGLVKSLAVELATRGIRVNCVAPGFVKTPMFDRVSSLWDAEQRAQVEAAHPLGLGEPEDVANSIVFLLADTGRWITGSVLVVDGGYTAR